MYLPIMRKILNKFPPKLQLIWKYYDIYDIDESKKKNLIER